MEDPYIYMHGPDTILWLERFLSLRMSSVEEKLTEQALREMKKRGKHLSRGALVDCGELVVRQLVQACL